MTRRLGSEHLRGADHPGALELLEDALRALAVEGVARARIAQRGDVVGVIDDAPAATGTLEVAEKRPGPAGGEVSGAEEAAALGGSTHV